MPTRPRSPCLVSGCPTLSDTPRCEAHTPSRAQSGRAGDPARSRPYKTVTWQRLRLLHLHAEPLCRDCGLPATQVDHVVPVAQGGAFFDDANLASQCSSCHSRKTASRDGGFGNARREAGTP